VNKKSDEAPKPRVYTKFAIFMFAAVTFSTVTAARDDLKIPPSLVGTKYSIARARILASGWRPDYRSADMEREKVLQKQYPELRHCAGDRPVCALFFVGKKGACLKVIVKGESPDEYRVDFIDRECDALQQ